VYTSSLLKGWVVRPLTVANRRRPVKQFGLTQHSLFVKRLRWGGSLQLVPLEL
jgi:hypothetical protein